MSVRFATLVEDSGYVGTGRYDTHKTKIYLEDVNKEVTAYTKFGISETSLLVEIITALIGRELGLPIPEPLLVADPVKQDVYFGCIEIQHPDLTRFLEIKDNRPLNTQANQAIYRKLSAWEYLDQSCVFDEWIANDDRNLGNVLFNGKASFHLIDHNRAMRLPFAENKPIEDNFLMKVNVAYNGREEIDALRLKREAQRVVNSISLNLPSEVAAKFLAENPEFSEETLHLMVSFLQTRLQHLFRISESKIPSKQQVIT